MTNQVHTTYEFSKRLKEFLGENAPEPMAKDKWWHLPTSQMPDPWYMPHKVPAYQLHDLLSKPFCEAFSKAYEGGGKNQSAEPIGFAHEFVRLYFNGGLPAVEAALMEMMEAK